MEDGGWKMEQDGIRSSSSILYLPSSILVFLFPAPEVEAIS
jgi:hypothetical protein